jgi:hypothetical protein
MKEQLADVIWCADIQKDLAEVLYVDTWHFTADIFRRVAECVFAGVSERLGRPSESASN